MDTIRLIEAFLENKLEGKELENFLERLKVDENLKEEIKLHREVNESILDDSQQLRKQINTLMNERKFPSSRFLLILSAIAALFVIGLAFISINKQSKLNDAFTEFYKPYDTDLNTRSSERNYSDVTYAYFLYQNKDYKTAFELLKNYNNSKKTNYMVVFYCGLSALELNLNSDAEKYLLQISSDNNSPYSLHADWYLSMLYLKTNNTPMAKKYLNKLSESKCFYSKRAQKILKKYF
jgi:hypothetical protein